MDPKIISMISNIILASAAVVTAYYARKGIREWRKQLKGKTEYELALSILKNTYKLEKAIKTVRKPMFFAYEFSESPKTDNDRTEQGRYEGWCYVYKTRWKNVENTRIDLQDKLLEGQVLWEEISECFSEIFRLENELFMSIQRYLTSQNPNVSILRKADKSDNPYRDIRLYEIEEEDDFSKEFKDAIKPIKEFLSPYLNKRSIVQRILLFLRSVASYTNPKQ